VTDTRVRSRPLRVCLIGPSCAGKSTLAKTVAGRRPNVATRVPVDHFFAPRPPEETLRDFLCRPLAYDWEALDLALASTDVAARSSPVCDFKAFRRLALTGGMAIPAAPVLLLDGMRPHPRCDVLVVLELDDAQQRTRLHERDQRWGTSVADNLDHLRVTYSRGRDEINGDPDLLLDATDPLDHNARRLEGLIDERLGDPRH
jgi:energy-coupling factor transporter ATP-binding protein EcfA2